ncbi:hypothetical protein DSO57_1037534 [Entomophthora muscae]|uniref:Uncharacterized protein n=1 Tax=Entomophthora muscae TaxID=34485 RepID=A0ACC2TKV2_9FUNG|nr:hypothetical protein DSO57_1037534 [Entomophthora muscae]
MSAPQTPLDNRPHPDSVASQPINPDASEDHKVSIDKEGNSLQGIALEDNIFSGIASSVQDSSSIFSELSLPAQTNASHAIVFPNVSLPFQSEVTESEFYPGMDLSTSISFSGDSLASQITAVESFLFPGNALSSQANMFLEKNASILDFHPTEVKDGVAIRIPDQSNSHEPSNSTEQSATPAINAPPSTEPTQGNDVQTYDDQATQADLSQIPKDEPEKPLLTVEDKTKYADAESESGSQSSAQAKEQSTSESKTKEVKERKRTKRKRVSDELRELIHAHAMDKLSNKEIALALRLPRQTVYSILNPKVPPPSDDNCPRTDKRFNKDRDAIQKRIIFYININPDMKTRDIQRLLGAEGYFISEKSVASWRQGTILAVQVLGNNKSNQVLVHEGANIFLQSFIGEDSGTLDSGVIYVSHHCIKISIRDFGQIDPAHKKPQSQDGKVGTLGAFFSIFLAVTGEGIIFSDSIRFIAPTPSIEESINKFFETRPLSIPGRKIVLSSCFEAQKYFYDMAAARGHSVVSMPENMTYGHLGEVIFYNLPRYIRSQNPRTRERVADLLATDETLFPKADIQALYQNSRAVTFGAILGPDHHLPPAKGIIPTPILPPSKDLYQEMADAYKKGEIMSPIPNLSQVLQEYTDMLF